MLGCLVLAADSVEGNHAHWATRAVFSTIHVFWLCKIYITLSNHVISSCVKIDESESLLWLLGHDSQRLVALVDRILFLVVDEAAPKARVLECLRLSHCVTSLGVLSTLRETTFINSLGEFCRTAVNAIRVVLIFLKRHKTCVFAMSSYIWWHILHQRWCNDLLWPKSCRRSSQTHLKLSYIALTISSRASPIMLDANSTTNSIILRFRVALNFRFVIAEPHINVLSVTPYWNRCRPSFLVAIY